MVKAISGEKRRYLRYPPDATETVQLQFSPPESWNGQFKAEIAALPSEESHIGLRLVLLRRPPIDGVEQGIRCLAKVNNLPPQPAVVRWVQAIDDDLVRIGLELGAD